MAEMNRSMRQRMVAGDDYLADDPELVEMLATSFAFMDRYNATATSDVEGQREILSAWLGSVGEEVTIRPPFRVDYGVNLYVGDRVFANFGLTALDVCEITIGDDAQIGPNVSILTPLHPIDAERRREKWEYGAPVAIGSNVWIGGGAKILPGVSIGDNTVIGAGSVVARDIGDNVVAVGNPARVVRHLDEE
ncbi:sugar O-acetyltransferase [Nocardioides sp. AE5]|uniref:sugar O-acetyltransferase n=1 Tax=Nocardioides sp. AE5 TaxID=2962573 RepID=UPI0028823771|nr:sugar O-acetyltransferase [Nocardioides sp. AE5]MDT0202982.1 sugar O-acetyltransferase [Nocardioides sp. AE5]